MHKNILAAATVLCVCTCLYLCPCQ